MGLRNTFAVMKDAPTTQRKEECASDTEQRDLFAVMTDVPTKFRVEEFV